MSKQVARGFGLRPKMCRPSANTENSRRMRLSLSRLTHANETKKATHTIIFLIVVILKSFPFPSSIMLQLFWCFLNPEMAVGFVPLRAEVSLLHGFCVACLSYSWFDYSPQKSDVNNLLHAKSHARGVTLFGGMEEWRNGGMEEWRNGGMME